VAASFPRLCGGVGYVRQWDLDGLDLRRARGTGPHKFPPQWAPTPSLVKRRPFSTQPSSDHTAERGTATVRRVSKAIDRLTVEDLTANRVLAFLERLKKERGCGAATRIQRLGTDPGK
jgi:hypothetical protein